MPDTSPVLSNRYALSDFPTTGTDPDNTSTGTDDTSQSQSLVKQTLFKEYVKTSILDRRSAWLEYYSSTFETLNILHKGGNDTKDSASSLLIRKPMEMDETFILRRQAFNYENFMGQAFSWFVAYLFEKQPEIGYLDPKTGDAVENLDTFYNDFRSNCDGAGTNLDDFLSHATEMSIRLQTAWILIDVPSLPTGTPAPASRLQADQLKLTTPYLSLFEPSYILDYKEDKYGNLESVKVKKKFTRMKAGSNSGTNSDINPLLAEEESVEQWYIYTKTEWALYEKDEDDTGEEAILIDSGYHATAQQNKCPFIRLSMPFDYWLGYRIMLPTIRYINYENQIAWQAMYCMLPTPVFTGASEFENKTYGTFAALNLPNGAKFDWMQPDGTSITVVNQLKDGQQESIFSLMHLKSQGRTGNNTPAVQSGIAKLREMTPSYEVSSKLGGLIRACGNTILSMVIGIRGDKYIPSLVGFLYLDSGLELLLDEEIKSSSLQIWSPSYIRKRMKMLIQAGMKSAPSHEIKKCQDEVDKYATDDKILAALALRVPVQAAIRAGQPADTVPENEPQAESVK